MKMVEIADLAEAKSKAANTRVDRVVKCYKLIIASHRVVWQYESQMATSTRKFEAIPNSAEVELCGLVARPASSNRDSRLPGMNTRPERGQNKKVNHSLEQYINTTKVEKRQNNDLETRSKDV